jgi:hypothetical protein
MSLPDSWTETCYIEITKEGEFAEINNQFSAITDTVDIDWGEKAIDWTATAVGGRIPTFTPETATTVTLELLPVGVAAPNGLSQIFIGNTTDASQPISSLNSRTRYKCRVVILWTDDTTITDASSATAATKAGLRFSFLDCYITGLTWSFTDDILKATATFSCPPFNKAGTGKITVEENDGSGVLPSLGNYTA